MATKTKAIASALTLVDAALEPEQVYMVVDLLYETAGLYPPDKTQTLIEYFENRLIDNNLPLTIEEYEGSPQSPEFIERKRVVLSFYEDDYADDEEEE
jgi:hypothetical protein